MRLAPLAALALALLPPVLAAQGASGVPGTAAPRAAAAAPDTAATARVLPIVAALAHEGRPDTITIAGRATVASGVLQARALDVALEDATGGIRLFSRTARIGVREGDSVVATGVIRRYRGGIELDAHRAVVIPAGSRLVAPRELARLHVGAEDEGRLVRVNGRVGPSGTSEGGTWMMLLTPGDVPKDTVTLWVGAAHAAKPALARLQPGDALMVTGIVSAFQDNPGDPRVWQLLPRGPADVRVISTSRSWLTEVRRVGPWIAGALLVLLLALAIGGRWLTRRHGRALREAEERYEQLLALSPDAVIVHADGHILFANPAAARLLEVVDAHQLVAQPIARFWPADAGEAAVVRAPAVDAAGGAVAGATTAPIRMRLLGAGGERVDVEASASPCRYHDRAATMVLARDIRAQLRHERELRALAQLDELTGFFNRRGFQLHADTLRREHAAAGRAVALVVADLDRLKAINDELGHAAGDAAIRGVAQALRGALGEEALIARWGGDEFVALVTPPPAATDPVEALAQRVQAELAAVPVDTAGTLLQAAASVGVAPLPAGGASQTVEALAVADAALYENKRARQRVQAEQAQALQAQAKQAPASSAKRSSRRA